MSKICKNCGNILRDEAKFCPKCGTKAEPVQVKADVKKQQSKKTTWLIAGIVSAIVVATVVSVLVFFNPFREKAITWEVSVPDVVNTEYEKAQNTLSDNTLHGLIYDKVESDSAAENNVVNQNPKAKEVVYKGSIVDLVLSTDHGKNYLPDTTYYTFEYAKKVLEDAGFRVKQEKLESSTNAPESVCAQSEKNIYTEKGKEITLKVVPEKEAQEEKVKVPDIEGMDIEKAKAELEKVGLYLAVNAAEYSDETEKNVIMKQEQSAGSRIQKGETVLVTISLGKETVYVPDVTYRTEAKAKEALKALGLEAEIKHEESRTVARGTVISQETKEGTEVDKGTKIVITVSSGCAVTVPDVVGEKEEQAIADLLNAGLAVNVIYKVDSSVEIGNVIVQNYGKGESVQIGTVVTVYISAKKESGEEVSSTEEETTTEETTENQTTETTVSTTVTTTTTKTTTTKPQTTVKAEQNKAKDWRNAYADFLEKCIEDDDYDYLYFNLVYINNDNIPELVCSEGNAHAFDSTLYAYTDSGVKKIKTFNGNGGFKYYERNNIIYSCYGCQGDVDYPVYKFNGSSVSLIWHGHSTERWSNELNGSTTDFWINDEPVTYEEFEAEFAENVPAEEKLSFTLGSSDIEEVELTYNNIERMRNAG